ncbi:MAG: phage tail sheath protein [Clostridiaceae bacterium]
MTYKHGIYGELVPSKEIITSGAIIPVYIGTAPVDKLTDSSNAINVPILIKNIEEAATYLGYSDTDDWDKYTLSAAIYAHFKNSILPIGPIACINVFDPEVHTVENPVDKTDIIGSYDANTNLRTGLKVLDIVYEELNLVPSIISAPGFNHIPDVEKALVNGCSKIGGRWEAICVTDIDPTATNINAAKTWLTTNQYKSNREKVCWPKGEMNNKPIWMSILTIVRMLQTDYSNDDIPYESPSNKPLDITGIIVNNTRFKFNIIQGNELNENGITTAIYNGGKWVLWGPHMANYEYGSDIKAEEIFDVNIKTNLYLLNDFQLRNANIIDSPISRNDIDAILNTEQLKLNSLISEGKLLYGNVAFNSESNPTSDLIQGDFVFDTAVTNTPPGKSLTTRVQYTSQGISSLTGGES